jgi:ribonuclease HI
MKENQILIFTDGSSRGNPGPGGYGFVVVYPNAHGEMLVEEGGGSENPTTNNRMEMMAVIKAFEGFDVYYDKAQREEKIWAVHLDSSYVRNGITKWVFGWMKNNWKTSTKDDVVNVDLWQQMMEATKGKNIEWNLLKGHAGIAGNERCDEIATGKGGELFKGKLSDYKIDILNTTRGSGAGSSAGDASSKKNKGKAYSYVSAVDGLVMTHSTWEQCEKRVKGAKGARFKKVFSAGEEGELIKEWGGK